MAITTKTGLWKLAAVRLGMSPSVHVLDATAPSTALELTFDQLYDQIRVAALRAGKYRFAWRTQELVPAPTIDSLGNEHEWTNRWRYVYASPTDSILFMRFKDDLREAMEHEDFETLMLPISYVESTLAETPGGDVIQSAVDQIAPPNMFRHSLRAYTYDGLGVKWTFEDRPVEGTLDSFKVYNVESGIEMPVIMGGSSPGFYGGANVWSLDFTDLIAGSAFVWSAGPVLATWAYGGPDFYSQLESGIPSTPHIATHRPSASAVYLVDVTDPSMWPVEFQNQVAAEMAFQASLVHAKSPRLIASLEREVARATSIAVSSLSSDDGHIEGGGSSRATRARY